MQNIHFSDICQISIYNLKWMIRALLHGDPTENKIVKKLLCVATHLCRSARGVPWYTHSIPQRVYTYAV